MTETPAAPFTAAMVQMRTAMHPQTSLAEGIRLIREAKDKGADYVQTPEVSNIIQQNRKALFEILASEEDDLSLKAYRELARELKIYLHIGSLALQATPERAVNRSFLIAPTAISSPDTTRSTCSTSPSRAARAIANPPTTSPAKPR